MQKKTGAECLPQKHFIDLSCTEKTFKTAFTATEGDSRHQVKSVAWKTWTLLFFTEPDVLNLY